jgi:hypothetical protein
MSRIREAEVLEAKLEELPINIIKAFLKVKFGRNIVFIVFRSFHEIADVAKFFKKRGGGGYLLKIITKHFQE